MSLAPIPTGSAKSVIGLEPGWTLGIDEFNMDVLKCRAHGTQTNMLLYCPNKYDMLGQTVLFPAFGGSNSVAGFSCSDRTFNGQEGLATYADLEFKGFLSGSARQAVASITWITTTYTATVVGGGDDGFASISFIGPAQAQITLKSGSTQKYASQIGILYEIGSNPNIPALPLQIQVATQIPSGGQFTLQLYATSSAMICIKDDYQEAGAYFERTQILQLGYEEL